MTDFQSGEFVLYDTTDTTAEPALGLVVLTASNNLANGESEDWVELIGPLPKILVPASNVRKFNTEPEPDPREVVDSSKSEVTGLQRSTDAKSVPTGPKPA